MVPAMRREICRRHLGQEGGPAPLSGTPAAVLVCHGVPVVSSGPWTGVPALWEELILSCMSLVYLMTDLMGAGCSSHACGTQGHPTMSRGQTLGPHLVMMFEPGIREAWPFSANHHDGPLQIGHHPTSSRWLRPGAHLHLRRSC